MDPYEDHTTDSLIISILLVILIFGFIVVTALCG